MYVIKMNDKIELRTDDAMDVVDFFSVVGDAYDRAVPDSVAYLDHGRTIVRFDGRRVGDLADDSTYNIADWLEAGPDRGYVETWHPDVYTVSR